MPSYSLDELSDRGLAIYENNLRPLLEPKENGHAVAIHIDSADYTVAVNSPEARRALRKRWPEGQIVTLTIGQEPDYALAARFLAGELKVASNRVSSRIA